MLADCTALIAALPRLVLLDDLACSYYPLLRSRWRLCRLTDAAHPLAGAALPILWECTVVSVYRQSLQCGERSNAAFRKQSAAEKTSLAPHDSKARLLLVTSSRGSWRSHVHRTYIAQRVQFFELQTANVRGQGARPLAFSWGIKRGPFSHVREWPPLTHPCTVQGNKNQRCRAVNPQTIGSSISLVAYAFSAQSARAPARYS